MAISSEIRERIIKDFPHLAHMLDNAELEKFWTDIFNRASTTGISDGEVAQLLWATPWFRNRTSTAREWDVLISQDPGEAKRRRDAARFKLRNMATNWGVTMTEAKLEQLVEQQLRWGMSDEEMLANLSNLAKVDESGPGMLTSTQDQLRGLADKYFQKLHDNDLYTYARDIMAGRTSVEAVQQLFRDRAKMDYAHLADKLDNYDMEQLTGSLRNRLAQLLDRDVSTIDLTSDRFAELISMTDNNGVTRMATATEVGRWGRKQTEFKGSDAGRAQGVTLISGIAKAMGRKG